MKLAAWFGLALTAAVAVGCGGTTSVDSSNLGFGNPTPDPSGGPTPIPTPNVYTVRVSFLLIHIYANGDSFGNSELYGTFAVNDQVEYSTQTVAGNPVDFNPTDYGITPVVFQVKEGDPFYIYTDYYDQNLNNNNSTPLGTVNTGWYAGPDMAGPHTVGSQNPYHYNLTYQVDILN